MAAKTQGGAYEARGRYFMRVTIAASQRRAVALPWVDAAAWAAHAPGDAPCPCVACVRARDVQALVTQYRAGGADLEMVEALLKSAATADAEKMAAIGRAVAGFCEGRIPKAKPSPASAKNTIRGIGERWTSGELHRLYRDHVRDKKSATDDGYRLETLCETGIADIPVERLTLDDADAAMGELDAVRQRIEDRRAKARGGVARRLAPLEPGGRRQYAQMISRICAMAVYPLKLIAVSPIPKGWLPRVPNDKAKGLVYPDEEGAFLGDATHAVHWRMFFGFLARAGFRADEGAGLTVDAVDVERGIIRLDENKTDDARAPTYVDVPGFVDALAWWKATYRKDAPPEAPFFVQPNGERIRVDGLAERYRTMLETTLRAAGLYRAELFVGGDRRMKVRVHDLRGAFVTYALANGRTETWVMDRTGHRSSHMVNRYRRVARTVAEAELGDLTPLDEAIPEVAAASTAAEAAARPKALDEKPHRTYRKHVAKGPIAQSVELRTFNGRLPTTPEDSRDVTSADDDVDGPSAAAQPLHAAATAASLETELRELVTDLRAMIADLRADNRRLRERLGEPFPERLPDVTDIASRRK